MSRTGPDLPVGRSEFLPFAPPAIGEEEIAEVVAALRSGWLTTGPRTARFESEFAARVGSPGALGLNSCTSALHLALKALGVGPGDEVITSTMTFVSTVNVIEHAGARPVLVDVEPDTLNLDPAAVERALTSRTRAIVPVHFAGHPAEMDPIRELAAARGIAIVEDAAHAIPASYRGIPVGRGPNPVAFSFYATKNLTTGEGGMLTGNEEFLARARVLSLHGMDRDGWKRYARGGRWFYEVVEPGYKCNMTDIQAALGLVQLRRLDEMQCRRREIVARYNAALSGTDALELPAARPHVEHAWHLFVIRLRLEALRIDRARFIDELAARNIGTSVHFIPVHLHPWYRERIRERFPVAEESYQRTVSLPLHPGLSDGDVDDVVDAVHDVIRRNGR